MKIFVIPAVFPSDNYPVAGIFIYQQCLALAKAGHKLVVLDASAMDYADWTKPLLFKEKKEWDKNLFWIYRKHHRGFMLSRFPKIALRSYEKSLRKLFSTALKEHGKPDLLYAHFSFCAGYVASKLTKEFNIACVVQEHASLFFHTQNKSILNMLNHTVNNADAFYTVSPALREKILHKLFTCTKNIGILHNIINPIFQFQEKVDKTKFIFFSAGNLIPIKAFDVLIQAFQKSFAPTDMVELRIAGTGREEKKLKSLAKNRPEQILFLGALNKEKMLEQYTEADCFTLASYTETFGLVYREAMAVGRPVVCTKNTGIAYRWNQEYGLLCEHSIDDLALALRDMYINASNYDERKISKMVLNDFGEAAFLHHFEEITKGLQK